MELPLPYQSLKLQQPTWILVISTLGLITFLRLLTTLLNSTYKTFTRPSKHLRSYGQYAVITGSTDGIGKALAFELASNGLHLLLLGRNPEKLSRVSSEIKTLHPETIITTVVADFSSDIHEGVRKLELAISGLDVGILVNNAGITHRRPRMFHEVEERKWMEMVAVNVVAVTAVSRAVLPGMVKRGRGAVVNIGSGSTVALPFYPFLTIYASTKKYVEQLSRSLYVEYKNSGIDVQCQVPLFVSTKMSNMRASIFVPSAEDYARSAVRCIGYGPRYMPGWSHSFQCWLASLLPSFVWEILLLEWAKRTRLTRRNPRD